MNALMEIQRKLKAPKNRRNSFGNYNYRSCEDILEGLKPILAEHDAVMTISDQIITVGTRVYVQATVTLRTPDGEYTTSAMAREAETKKGMDDSQITGMASSYARKYALNGMFLIDDTKDADTDEYRQETEGRAQTEAVGDKKITKTKAAALLARCEKDGVNIVKLFAWCKVKVAEDITERQYSSINQRWEEVVKAYGNDRAS